jgi:hypothetical protein
VKTEESDQPARVQALDSQGVPAHMEDPEQRVRELECNKQKTSLLVFWAVAAEDRVIDLVTKNIAHLRKTFGRCGVDVFLAHYDLNQQSWINRDASWYHTNVQFSAEHKGYKFQLMQELLVKHFDLSPYTWVWALDEDIDFTSTDLKSMIDLADDSGALLALPSFTQLGSTPEEQELDYPVQSPHPVALSVHSYSRSHLSASEGFSFACYSHGVRSLHTLEEHMGLGQGLVQLGGR